GQCPCPAYHQIGPGIGLGHVFDKGLHLGLHADRSVGLAGLVQMMATTLVTDLRALAGGQQGQRQRQQLVQRQRTQAPAQHQQTRLTQPVPDQGRYLKDVLTYRVAGGAPGTAGGKAVVETFAATGGNVRQQPVGGAVHRVLFMNHQRDTAQPGRYATGSGNVAAGTQHHRRLQLAQYLQGLPQGADQTYRCQQQPQLALAAQSLDIDEMQGDAGL